MMRLALAAALACAAGWAHPGPDAGVPEIRSVVDRHWLAYAALQRQAAGCHVAQPGRTVSADEAAK